MEEIDLNFQYRTAYITELADRQSVARILHTDVRVAASRHYAALAKHVVQGDVGATIAAFPYPVHHTKDSRDNVIPKPVRSSTHYAPCGAILLVERPAIVLNSHYRPRFLVSSGNPNGIQTFTDVVAFCVNPDDRRSGIGTTLWTHACRASRRAIRVIFPLENLVYQNGVLVSRDPSGTDLNPALGFFSRLPKEHIFLRRMIYWSPHTPTKSPLALPASERLLSQEKPRKRSGKVKEDVKLEQESEHPPQQSMQQCAFHTEFQYEREAFLDQESVKECIELWCYAS